MSTEISKKDPWCSPTFVQNPFEEGPATYLTLVPRGLQAIAKEWLLERVPDVTPSIWLGERGDEAGKYLQELKEFKNNDNSTVVGILGHYKLAVAVGYDAEGLAVWTKTGQHSYVWWQFQTKETPPPTIARLRGLGPIMALAVCQEVTAMPESLDGMIAEFQRMLDTDVYRQQLFPAALRVWQQVALKNWSAHMEESKADARERLEKLDCHHLADNHRDSNFLKFRISCLRHESVGDRRDLIAGVPEYLTPKHWVVDLKHYDVEIVLLIRETHIAVALTLHAHQYLGSKSFSAGTLPTDVSPPLVTGKGFVRLRPSTAQLLLHLARLVPGAVVLDPFVGVGTIAQECAYFRAVGLGGDISLTPTELGTLATQYSNGSQQANGHSTATVLAWDAAYLPLREAFVDAVVSDLPFGRLCLSSGKLQQLLPLAMNELARVLKPGTGRMVLLCGHYKNILEALEQVNRVHQDQDIWVLPCTALIPVNIGGSSAWVIQVRRGTGAWQPESVALERVRKMARKRFMDKARGSSSDKKTKIQA